MHDTGELKKKKNTHKALHSHLAPDQNPNAGMARPPLTIITVASQSRNRAVTGLVRDIFYFNLS